MFLIRSWSDLSDTLTILRSEVIPSMWNSHTFPSDPLQYLASWPCISSPTLGRGGGAKGGASKTGAKKNGYKEGLVIKGTKRGIPSRSAVVGILFRSTCKSWNTDGITIILSYFHRTPF